MKNKMSSIAAHPYWQWALFLIVLCVTVILVSNFVRLGSDINARMAAAMRKIPEDTNWKHFGQAAPADGMYHYEIVYRSDPTATSATRDARLVAKTVIDTLLEEGRDPKAELPVISITAFRALSREDNGDVISLGTAFYDFNREAVVWSRPDK